MRRGGYAIVKRTTTGAETVMSAPSAWIVNWYPPGGSANPATQPDSTNSSAPAPFVRLMRSDPGERQLRLRLCAAPWGGPVVHTETTPLAAILEYRQPRPARTRRANVSLTVALWESVKRSVDPIADVPRPLDWRSVAERAAWKRVGIRLRFIRVVGNTMGVIGAFTS